MAASTRSAPTRADGALVASRAVGTHPTTETTTPTGLVPSALITNSTPSGDQRIIQGTPADHAGAHSHGTESGADAAREDVGSSGRSKSYTHCGGSAIVSSSPEVRFSVNHVEVPSVKVTCSPRRRMRSGVTW